MVDAPIPRIGPHELNMTLEHVLPVVRGGTHELWNLVLACFQCNNRRGDCPDDFDPPWALRMDPAKLFDPA